MIKSGLAIIGGIAISGLGIVLYLYKRKLDNTIIFSFSLNNNGKKISEIKIYKNSKNNNDDTHSLECIKKDIEKIYINDNILFVKNIAKTYQYFPVGYAYSPQARRIVYYPNHTRLQYKSTKTTYDGILSNLIDNEVNVNGNTTYKLEHINKYKQEILYIKKEIRAKPNGKYLLSFNTHKKQFTCIGYNTNIINFYLMI